MKIVIHQISYSGLGEIAGSPIGGKDQKNKDNTKQLIMLNEELKDNNKDLFIEIDKYTKRIRQLENDNEREREQKKEMD